MIQFHSLEVPQLERFLERHKSGLALGSEVDLDLVLREVLQKAYEFVPSESGSILLDDPIRKVASRQDNELVFIATFGDASRELVGKRLSETGIADEDRLKQIDKDIRAIVNEAADFGLFARLKQVNLVHDQDDLLDEDDRPAQALVLGVDDHRVVRRLLVAVGVAGLVPFDIVLTDVNSLGGVVPWWMPLAILAATTAIGYSFSIDETFEEWGRHEIVGDYVRLIRLTRPDLIVTMRPDGTGGGQHHQAGRRSLLRRQSRRRGRW